MAVTSTRTAAGWSLTVDVPEIPLVVPERARAACARLLTQALHMALLTAAGAISAEAPVDTGHLAQSFSADPANAAGGIELLTGAEFTTLTGRVFSALPYAVVMNEGRQPGAPISRVGVDALGLWAQRKLGLSADEAERAKWAIAASIVAKGLQGRHYLEAGVQSATPKIEALFAAVTKGIAEALTEPHG